MIVLILLVAAIMTQHIGWIIAALVVAVLDIVWD